MSESAESSMRKLSSDDPIFDDIRPCRDDEVKTELAKICSDKSVLDGILRFRYPILSKWCGLVLRPLVRRYIKNYCDKINSIADFQDKVAAYMRHMIDATTDGVTFKGFDKLDPKRGYLFISNHRDISLDPAFIDLALHDAGFDTVRIAIGDNLLKTEAASSLMRLNKSFIVKRSISAPREKLKAMTHLSSYIGSSLSEGHSIWIAEREGRAKDGDDRVEEAVLKMISLYGRSLKQDFSTYMSSLNIVPVSITYEYDPADLSKARELKERDENNGQYQKGELEDIESIIGGIKGYKGRVSVVAGDPITSGFSSPQELAQLIDSFIWQNYELYPSIMIASGKDSTVKTEDKDKFMARINAYPEELRSRVLAMYAKPYENRNSLNN